MIYTCKREKNILIIESSFSPVRSAGGQSGGAEESCKNFRIVLWPLAALFLDKSNENSVLLTKKFCHR